MQIHHVLDAEPNQKKVSVALKITLQMLVRYHIGTRKQARCSVGAAIAFNYLSRHIDTLLEFCSTTFIHYTMYLLILPVAKFKLFSHSCYHKHKNVRVLRDRKWCSSVVALLKRNQIFRIHQLPHILLLINKVLR